MPLTPAYIVWPVRRVCERLELLWLTFIYTDVYCYASSILQNGDVIRTFFTTDSPLSSKVFETLCSFRGERLHCTVSKISQALRNNILYPHPVKQIIQFCSRRRPWDQLWHDVLEQLHRKMLMGYAALWNKALRRDHFYYKYVRKACVPNVIWNSFTWAPLRTNDRERTCSTKPLSGRSDRLRPFQMSQLLLQHTAGPLNILYHIISPRHHLLLSDKCQ